MELGLRGKVVLVAGASQGIGRAAAELFALEGARVAMLARDPLVLRQAADLVAGPVGGEMVLPIRADVGSPGEVEAAVEAVHERWGRLDAVVNAVGQGVRSTLENASSEVWSANLQANLMSAVTLTRAARPALLEGGRGSVVLLGAASGIQPTPGQLVSNVHKAALIAFGRSAAQELAPHGVRVNVVCPGRILTPRRLARAEEEASAAGITVDEHLGRIAQTIPMGRWGSPEQVATLIAFLTSHLADYITGQVICVDGGLVVAPGRWTSREG